MNKLIVLFVMTYIGLSQATEHAYLYKDLRIMGAGGANVSSGGYSGSIFINPAGIAYLPKDSGMVVEVLGLSNSFSDNAYDMASDLFDAIDSKSTDNIVDVFTKYTGDKVHLDVSNYSSLSKNHGNYAWSVGLLAVADYNATAHANSYDLLEVQSRVYGGITGAYSYTFKELGNGDLSLGIGGKIIAQRSFEGALTPTDLIDMNEVDNTLRDKFTSDGQGLAIDLGLIYQFHTATNLKPALGLSIMNIGSLTFGDSYGHQPTQVNIGASIEPHISFLKRTRVSLDYADLLNANKTRIYNLDSDNNISYTDYDDTDVIKRLRFGVSGLVYDNHWSSLELSTGIYQGHLTAGIDVTASVIRLSFATYEEELGPNFGDESDRRYSLLLGVAW